MLLLVLLQVRDTLGIFSLLLMTNQVVFCQGEIITHFRQLLCKLLVFLQQRLPDKNTNTSTSKFTFTSTLNKTFTWNKPQKAQTGGTIEAQGGKMQSTPSS